VVVVVVMVVVVEEVVAAAAAAVLLLGLTPSSRVNPNPGRSTSSSYDNNKDATDGNNNDTNSG